MTDCLRRITPAVGLAARVDTFSHDTRRGLHRVSASRVNLGGPAIVTPVHLALIYPLHPTGWPPTPVKYRRRGVRAGKHVAAASHKSPKNPFCLHGTTLNVMGGPKCDGPECDGPKCDAPKWHGPKRHNCKKTQNGTFHLPQYSLILDSHDHIIV